MRASPSTTTLPSPTSTSGGALPSVHRPSRSSSVVSLGRSSSSLEHSSSMDSIASLRSARSTAAAQPQLEMLARHTLEQDNVILAFNNRRLETTNAKLTAENAKLKTDNNRLIAQICFLRDTKTNLTTKNKENAIEIEELTNRRTQPKGQTNIALRQKIEALELKAARLTKDMLYYKDIADKHTQQCLKVSEDVSPA